MYEMSGVKEPVSLMRWPVTMTPSPVYSGVAFMPPSPAVVYPIGELMHPTQIAIDVHIMRSGSHSTFMFHGVG